VTDIDEGVVVDVKMIQPSDCRPNLVPIVMQLTAT